MNQFTTDLVQSTSHQTNITEVFRFYLEDAINHLFETELTALTLCRIR